MCCVSVLLTVPVLLSADFKRHSRKLEMEDVVLRAANKSYYKVRVVTEIKTVVAHEG